MTLACTAVPPVGIVGIGTMGSQIAELNLRHGIPVRLFDVQPSSRSVPRGLNAGEPTGLQASKSDSSLLLISMQNAIRATNSKSALLLLNSPKGDSRS